MPLTREQIQQARRLHRKGQQARAIAAELGLSYADVCMAVFGDTRGVRPATETNDEGTGKVAGVSGGAVDADGGGYGAADHLLSGALGHDFARAELVELEQPALEEWSEAEEGPDAPAAAEASAANEPAAAAADEVYPAMAAGPAMGSGYPTGRPRGGQRRYQVADALIHAAWTNWQQPRRGMVAAIAQQLGVPRSWLTVQLTRLGLAVPRAKEPNWTAAEDAMVPTLPLYNPKRCATIMREAGFNRTPAAIVIRARKLELNRRDSHETYSANQAAQILGLDGKTVGTYCEQGIIAAERQDDERTIQQGGHRWSIQPDALRAFARGNLERIDFRQVDKFAFFALIDVAAPQPAAAPVRDPVKGWTADKRKRAYRRFGEIIIQVADELNVPANELLAYALKGDVPPTGRKEGFEDTKVPGVAALPAPAPAKVSPLEAKAPPREPQTRYRRQWPLDKVAELRRLAEVEKLTSAALATHFEVSKRALYSACTREGISITAAPRPKKEPAPKAERYWSADRIAQLRQLAEVEQVPGREIARLWGISAGAIAGVCRRQQIKLHGQMRTPKPPRRPKVRAPSAPRKKPAGSAIAVTSNVPRPIMARAVPAQPSNGWIRLQNRDGRWLRLDALGWVDNRNHGYIGKRSQLKALREKFALVAECVVVPEQTGAMR